jgi:alkyl sulfatase BDS1-like metallo-beta-lactamase superfamily hydrolase
VRGADVFVGPQTQVVAHRLHPVEMQQMMELLRHRWRTERVQFGTELRAEDRGVTLAAETESVARPMPKVDAAQLQFDARGYVPPHVLCGAEHRFNEGSVEFELYHFPGETADHLNVWLPQKRAWFCGDLFYRSFPMLNNPMKPDRPVLAWADSLDRIRAFEPDYLIPSHGRPMVGKAEIQRVLGNYVRAIRSVYEQTLNGINAGIRVEQLCRQVRLPEELARLPYLKETYGKVSWAVKGIYRQCTGWYGFNPTDLRRCPRDIVHKRIVAACGGPKCLNSEAQRAFDAGHHQMVLELTDIVLAAQPRNAVALRLRASSLRQLGLSSQNGVERNIYLAAAAELAR